jgi:putative membrane protein
MSPVDRERYPTADDVSVELSMRRTGMSFQRTRMSADRTLMSIIRTALSLISFGFTIYQVFSKWVQLPNVNIAAEAPRNFGIALVVVGVLLLALGIVYHVRYMQHLRAERKQMIADGLIHGESAYPVSLVLLCAMALLLIGLMAIVSMVFNIPVFS